MRPKPNSVAYVLATVLGVSAEAKSIPFIAGWSRADRAMIEATAGHVLSAVATLADALVLDTDPVEETG